MAQGAVSRRSLSPPEVQHQMSVTRRDVLMGAIGGMGAVAGNLCVGTLRLPSASAKAAASTAAERSIARALAQRVPDAEADQVEAYVRHYGQHWLSHEDGQAGGASEYLKWVQEAGGICPSGVIDRDTVRLTIHTPRCGVIDPAPAAGQAVQLASRWESLELTYAIMSRDSDLPADRWDAEMRVAFDRWSAITPLKFTKQDRQEGANLILRVGAGRADDFDGAGGVLAWAQLPPTARFNGQLLSKFDAGERWVDQRGQGGIVLRAVACHEFGHLLGLDHSRNRAALMAPFYSPNVLCPQQADDVERIQSLYGKPTSPPSGPPIDPPPGVPGPMPPTQPPTGPTPPPTRPGGPDTDPGCVRVGNSIARIYCR